MIKYSTNTWSLKNEQREKEKLELKFKNIFLSSVSHNLKTPLNSNEFICFSNNLLGIVMNNEILENRFKE